MRMCMLGCVLLMAAASLAWTGSALARPVDICPAERGCEVEGGRYRLALPATPPANGKFDAIMFFHGWQGSAEETVSDPDLLALAERLGIALIAPDGAGKTWSFPGAPGAHRDEFAFVAHVLEDVSRRFPIDPQRILASGFSQGSSMIWYLACRMPGRFKGFAAIAGAFWEPLPSSCAGPRPPFIHVHGTTDTTVPLAGRALRGGYRQGDVLRSLAILAPDADRVAADQVHTAATSLSCRPLAPGPETPLLELCLHGGGHLVDTAWIERAWRRLMMAPALAGSHVSVKP